MPPRLTLAARMTPGQQCKFRIAARPCELSIYVASSAALHVVKAHDDYPLRVTNVHFLRTTAWDNLQ